MEKYVIKVNDTEFKVGEDDLNGLDLRKLNADEFHVLSHHTAFDVKLIGADFSNRRLSLHVNGNRYDVKISDRYDQLVDQMGLLTGASQKARNIKAPMPGLIMDILVERGQKIEEGTPLLVLSAMKMENQILALGTGTITSIEVNVGDTVDKGQLIIEMES